MVREAILNIMTHGNMIRENNREKGINQIGKIKKAMITTKKKKIQTG